LSINWQTAVTPRPALLVLPPDVDSLDEAHAAIELWEFYSRKRLDPPQRLVVEVMMAESGGRWAARTTGREMPRQNGKGDELEVVELWGIVQRGEAILHTAHELTTVSSAHQRMVGLIEAHPDLRRMKVKILNGIGQQLIELRNPKTGLTGVIAYRTRTNGGGRGLDDISRLVVDEAQHAKPEQLASSTPILLANPNPQMNFSGTGAIAGVSDWWWTLRTRALGVDPGQFGYVGHTAEDVSLDPQGNVLQVEVDASDESLWFVANPALHYGRAEVEFFREQHRTLGPALFAREHMGVWDPPPGEAGTVIPNWHELADPESRIAAGHAWALAVSPVEHGPQWASLGVAGRTEAGLLQVEWMEHRKGTHWVIQRVVEAQKSKPIALRVHSSGPEAALIPGLREAGVDVLEVPSAEVERATGMLIAAATGEPDASPSLVHLGQPSLDKAVRGAVLRTGTNGAAMWSQKNSRIEITPLQAVTVALGGVPLPSRAPRVHVYSGEG
jgi:hypothetical protein